MKKYQEKTHEIMGGVFVNVPNEKSGYNRSAFINNHSASVIQKKLNRKINASPRFILQKKQVEKISNNTPPNRLNNTGLPDKLKKTMEQLSGYDLGNVRVHYNSLKPSLIKAHAFTRGSNIHIAPGQERHLAHETWHVVQQMQGRVNPTFAVKGFAINDNAELEKEADDMGRKADLLANSLHQSDLESPVAILRKGRNSVTENSAMFNRTINQFKRKKTNNNSYMELNGGVIQADCGCSSPQPSVSGVSLINESTYNDGTKYGLIVENKFHGTRLGEITASEIVSASIDHTGCFTARPSAHSNNSSYLPANSVRTDHHTSSIADHLSYYDKHGGNGSYNRLQMFIFKVPGLGMTTPQAAPNSGYRLTRTVRRSGSRVQGIISKSKEAVTVNGYSSQAGITAIKSAKTFLR